MNIFGPLTRTFATSTHFFGKDRPTKKNRRSNLSDELLPQRDRSFDWHTKEVVGKSVVEKLIRIQAGHRAAFKKLEKKVEDLFTPISDEEELIEAVARLAMMKSKHQRITRHDAEVELKIVNHRLVDDMEKSAIWERKMMIAEPRLAALLDNFKKTRDSRPKISRGHLFIGILVAWQPDEVTQAGLVYTDRFVHQMDAL